MSTPKKPPPRFADTMPPYNPLEPMPQPDVTETSSDTTWEMWEEVKQNEGQRYADTQPMTKPGQRFSPTQPQTRSPGAPLRTGASTATSGLQKLVEESRRNNRVCPQPAKWHEMDSMLRALDAAAAQTLPKPPLTAVEWRAATPLAKRLMFKGVVDWAAENNQVETALKFVRALPEEQWLHMGE